MSKLTKEKLIKLMAIANKTNNTLIRINNTKKKIQDNIESLSNTIAKTIKTANLANLDFEQYCERFAYGIDVKFHQEKYAHTYDFVKFVDKCPKYIKFIESMVQSPIEIKTTETLTDCHLSIEKIKTNITNCGKQISAEVKILKDKNSINYKILNTLFDRIKKIETEIQSQTVIRKQLYENIINEIIDGRTVQKLPIHDIQIGKHKQDIQAQIELTKLEIKRNISRIITLNKNKIEYMNVANNNMYNNWEMLYGRMIADQKQLFMRRSRDLRNIITRLQSKHKTAVLDLEKINIGIKPIMEEYSKSVGSLHKYIRQDTITQNLLWNLAVDEFNSQIPKKD